MDCLLASTFVSNNIAELEIPPSTNLNFLHPKLSDNKVSAVETRTSEIPHVLKNVCRLQKIISK